MSNRLDDWNNVVDRFIRHFDREVERGYATVLLQTDRLILRTFVGWLSARGYAIVKVAQIDKRAALAGPAASD